MKNNILYIFCALFLFVSVSCSEDTPSRSGADVERLRDSLDLNYPLVKDYYDNKGVAILHRFDELQDLKFDFHDVNSRKFWDGLVLTKINRQSEVDSAMDVLQDSILCAFKDEFEFAGKKYKSEFVRKYLPTKILLVDNLISEWGASLSLPTESVNRASENLQGIIHGAINDNAVVMNLNSKVMGSSVENYRKYKNDIVYFLLAFSIDKYNLYDSIPARFYTFSSEYYGKKILEALEERGECTDRLGDTVRYIAKADYVNKFGIISNSVFPHSGSRIATTFTIADKKRDVRLFLDQLISPEAVSGGSTPIWKMSSVMKKKMWYLAHGLMDLGIDVREFNRDPEFLRLLNLSENELFNE